MDSAYLRQRARDSLEGRWGLSIGVAAVAALLGGLIVGISFLPDIQRHVTEQTSFGRLTLSNGISIGFNGGGLGLAAMIIGGVLQLGYAQFLLRQQNRGDGEFNDLFSYFDRFGAGFAQSFLRELYSALWGLLFVIPGIVAGYSYAMTPFLMVEFPELTASEAIARSKQIMDGHKMDLFLLDLSFFGWMLLAALTLNIGNLWLNPYRNASHAAFYLELRKAQRNVYG